jgi:hypothetical protein
MKISHECPISLFEESKQFNDYDYALVHLFETKPQYYQYFKDAIAEGRHVILDNSIFELGTAFDPEQYAHYIKELQPTEYIIPDALEDAATTISNAKSFIASYPDLPGKTIGVVQGKTYDELVKCYNYMNSHVDKIAISFDYSYYLEVCPHPNKWIGYALGRAVTLTRMYNEQVTNTAKPHHLLGCASPIEFSFYRCSKFDWIDSLDTSNPIVHGLLGIKYEPAGLLNKQSIKMCDMIDMKDFDEKILKCVEHNINLFRSYVKGVK